MFYHSCVYSGVRSNALCNIPTNSHSWRTARQSISPA